MLNTRLLLAAAALSAAAVFPAAAGTVDVYLSAPFTQTATTSGAPSSGGLFSPGYTNAVTETFDATTAGGYSSLTSSALNGTFTSPGAFAVQGNNQFGGGSQGNYLGVSGTGETTLTLATPVGYLGLEWCAVDAGNNLSLYDQNGALIGTFNAATFGSLLANNTTITAINGATYNTVDYAGQPTGTSTTSVRQNTGEYYAFLNFIAGPGTQISKIVLTQGTSAIFESDNYAVLANAPGAPLGSFVRVTSVPEPSAWAMIGLAVTGLAVVTIRRRRA